MKDVDVSSFEHSSECCAHSGNLRLVLENGQTTISIQQKADRLTEGEIHKACACMRVCICVCDTKVDMWGEETEDNGSQGR